MPLINNRSLSWGYCGGNQTASAEYPPRPLRADVQCVFPLSSSWARKIRHLQDGAGMGKSCRRWALGFNLMRSRPRLVVKSDDRQLPETRWGSDAYNSIPHDFSKPTEIRRYSKWQFQIIRLRKVPVLSLVVRLCRTGSGWLQEHPYKIPWFQQHCKRSS